jgi:nitrogen fixation negative regulator NifL
MHWALPTLIALAAIVWSYLFFRRNARLARQAQARADLLAAALEQSPAVVGITDLQGNLEYVNPAFEQASGYTAAELLGQNPRVLKSGVTPPEHYHNLWETITEGRVWTSELCNKRKDGQLYWEWASIAPVTDSQGRTRYFVKVAEDITARKKSEAALLESEKRFRSIFELAGAGIALVDRRGRWLEVNDHLSAILGFSRNELRGRPLLDFIPEEDRAQVSGWKEPFESGETASSTTERRFQARDGREVWVEFTASLVRDPLGAPEYFICLIQDVTRRKQAEDEASRQQDQLAHINRIHTLQQMASELAHEIDQPLCAILSAAQAAVRLLDSGRPEDILDARAALDLVTGQAARAGTVVDSIREFSRKQNPEKRLLAPGEIAERTLDLLAADLRTHQVQVKVSGADGNDALVMGDPTLLTQVLVNLVRNGVDAMLAAGGTARRLELGWSREGDRVTMSVFNAGPPISADLTERIFVPFFTTRPDGLGLGLSLSRSIVESYGGRLWVEPGQEEGTTFFVRLPAATDSPTGGLQQEAP